MEKDVFVSYESEKQLIIVVCIDGKELSIDIQKPLPGKDLTTASVLWREI